MIIDVVDRYGKLHKIKIYNAKNFPLVDVMRNVNIVKSGKNKYFNVPCAFDIETSSMKIETLNKQGKVTYKDSYGFMYLWQFCIGDTVCMGRRWEEFQYFMNRLHEYNFNHRAKYMIFCHFLGFEFQFMKEFITITSLFAREKRLPISVRTDFCEFRCSYLLSNMSLAKFLQMQKGVTFYKKDGCLDYEIIRTADTKLTNSNLEYAYCDVRGLCQGIWSLAIGDLSTLPLTSTGFVRNEFREHVTQNPNNFKDFQRMALNTDTYLLAKKAIRGGNVHALIINSNQVLEDVGSYDKKSSYPASMLLDKVPASKFVEVTINSQEKFDYYIEHKACLFTFVAENVSLKSLRTIPYIDRGHSYQIRNGRYDNGRILSAQYLTMSVTDVDWKIIKRQYHMEGFVVTKMYVAEYGMFNLEFRELLLKFFRNKCKLEYERDKHEKGSKEYEDINYIYNKFKNKINGSYGMAVTDIAHEEVIYENLEWNIVEPDVTYALKQFYKSKRNFMTYQQGMWVPAWGRSNLQDALDLTGIDTVYSDTDSVKYLNEHKQDFEYLNSKILKQIEENELDIIQKIGGKEYTVGTWEYEGTYKRFKTMGSKCYCSEDYDGKITVTVSGLNKEKGSIYLQNNGGMKLFKKGTIFYDSGRTIHYYNDAPKHYINVNGCQMLTGSSVAVFPTTYKLGITNEYLELLEDIKNETGI